MARENLCGFLDDGFESVDGSHEMTGCIDIPAAVSSSAMGSRDV